MHEPFNLLLTKAKHDLEVARLSQQHDAVAFIDQVLYLCHQAAEKAMKAALLGYAEIPTKTHMLPALINRLIEHDPKWESCRAAAALLSERGLVVRYLESFTDAEFAIRAIEAASLILQQAETILAARE